MSEEDYTAPLASLSLTHVYYDPTDHLSHLCAYLALVPQALVIVYVVLLLCCRELEIGLMFAGQLACEAANFALKRLIKEERPKGQMTLGKGYGMPSSHAQFVAFWAVYLGLFMMARHSPKLATSSPTTTERAGGGSVGLRRPGTATMTNTKMATTTVAGAWGSFLERLSTSVLAMVIAIAVAWSRVYLNYHTSRQVFAGWCAGVVCALAWFIVTTVARRYGLLGWLLELPLVRLFRIRDLVLTEDPAQAGWEKWEVMRLQGVARKES